MSVELVRWDDRFSNGIAEVDEQHRNLFMLVNRTYRAVVERANSAQVQDIVRALEEYTIEHFADEERYMTAARYPHFGEHKKIHDDFVARVAQERGKLQAGFPLDLSIVHFLRDWLVEHILKQDMDFGRYERGADAKVRSARKSMFRRGLGGWMRGLFGGAGDAPLPPAEAITQIQAPRASAGRADVVTLPVAIEYHMRWKGQFESALEDAQANGLDPQTVSRDDASALGQWLHGEARDRFGRAPELDDVLMWHAELHRQAASIAEVALGGDREAVRAGLARGPYATAALRLRGALSKMFATEPLPQRRNA